MARSRAWTFTLNNYTPEEELKTKEFECAYIVYGRERGEEGTPHLQGYVYLQNPIRLTTLKEWMPRGHFESAKATSIKNREYCIKQGDFFEKGVIPKQGKRNDIDEVRDLLGDGGTMRDVVETAPSYQSMKVAEMWFKYCEKPRDWEPEVYWFWGPPGSGKTRAVYEISPQVYSVPFTADLKWWDGYDAHPDILIDDFRGDHCVFPKFLRLTDRYEFRVETKGGMRQCRARRIFITSAVHPKDAWFTNENLDQIKRRFREIKYFPRVNIPDCPGWHVGAQLVDPLDA